MSKIEPSSEPAAVRGLDSLGSAGLQGMSVDDNNIWRDRSKSLGQLEMEATVLEEQEKATEYSEKMSVTLPMAITDELPDPSALFDWLKYVLENQISAFPFVPFLLLGLLTCGGLLVFAVLWQVGASRVEEADGDIFGTEWTDALFMHLMLIVSAGYEDVPDENGLRYIFFFSIFFGLVIFAILVGFITDKVGQFMTDLDKGRTKVAEDGHTLILGWNEATQRVVVQISFLRRQYQMLNESKYFGILWYFPFLKGPMDVCGLLERPSTSLANSDIVIMSDTKTKEEMHIMLGNTLSERGINPRRTALGLNIICRIGDPTLTTDLLRVSAQKAAAIVVMMTEDDQEEEDASDGKIQNGATLRVCLALRHVLFTHAYSDSDEFHPELRIVLQMTSPSQYVDATNFKNASGLNVIIPMDLSKFLNSLMFLCAAQPGLSKVLLGILDFEGASIRRRKAKNLRSGPKNAYGDCIGQTFGRTRQQFTKAVFIGIVRPGMPADKIKSSGFGLLPRPDIVIEPDDLLIFIGPKSSPAHDYSMLDTFGKYLAQASEIVESRPDIAKARMAHLAGMEAGSSVAPATDAAASSSRDDGEDSTPAVGGGGARAPLDEAGGKKSFEHSVKKKENMIVAGWRPVWLLDPTRFRDRLLEVANVRLPGSLLTFVNFVDPEEFETMMQSIGCARLDNEVSKTTGDTFRLYSMCTPHEGIRIKHFYGDAAEPAVIDEIVSNTTIHTAIVLGTQANAALSSRSRDTRVLNIMLLLRKFWAVKQDNVPMHVVGENQKDETAKLALGPRKANNVSQERFEKTHGTAGGRRIGKFVERQPDFINTQAVFARAVTQTLAYPIISSAVTELLNSGPGFVDVVIVAASDYVPLGTPILYGVVRALVLSAEGERAICLGIMPISGDPKVNPPHDKKYTLNRDDRLIVLRRKLLPGESSGL